MSNRTVLLLVLLVFIIFISSDILVCVIFIGRGSFIDFNSKINVDITYFNFINSTIDFFILSMMRVSISTGIFIGFYFRGSIGSIFKLFYYTGIILLLLFPMIKLLAFSELRHMEDLYFWLLFVSSSLYTIVLYFLEDIFYYSFKIIYSYNEDLYENITEFRNINKKRASNFYRLLTLSKPDIHYIAAAVSFMIIASVC